MRTFILTLFLCLALISAGAQTVTKPAAKGQKKPAAKPTPNKTAAAKTTKPRPKAGAETEATAPIDDKSEFEKASAISDAEERAAALKKFIATFPNSTYVAEANALLSAAEYSAGDTRLTSGQLETALEHWRSAVDAAPKPIPDALFNESLSKIPTALYWTGKRAEAFELAKSLETRTVGNAGQLITLTMFYVVIEDGVDAVRVAKLATEADANSAKAFQTLGLAYRVNFQLEDSAAAYAKALELDPTSVSIKQNLAEIKRALGKADEAVALYRDVIGSDATNQLARNGYILSLFDAGKKDEAESELAKALDQDPKNVMLMAGAAYWYAANKNGEKAIDLAQKAVTAEPRYVWSYVAWGRGLMLQNRPLEAEEILLRARQYGNFPTLEYELASARMMSGFFREAAEGLQRSFSVSGDGVETKIGGRVERTDASFAGILADERRASILEPMVADDAETSAKLKSLLLMSSALSTEKPDEAAVVKATDEFVAGDDKFKLHRELYAAAQLLNKKIAPAKALEYATAAVGGADAALDVPSAGAAVMASELYESRQIAFAHDELVQVPTVPKQMLAGILRGRIEELMGRALVLEEKPADAVIHFKRAVSIMPDQSAWWRSSMWNLGTALQADGKEADALDAYIKSYSIDKPDLVRYTIVETLYKKLNGSTDGLEAKIGKSPLAAVPSTEVAKNIEPTPNVSVPAAVADPTPTPVPANLPIAVNPSPSPEVVSAIPKATPVANTVAAEVGPAPTPSPEAAPTPTATPEATPAATTTPTPMPEAIPAATPTATPTPEPSPVATIAPEPTPTPTATPESSPAPMPAVSPEVTPTQVPDTTPSPVPTPEKNVMPLPTPDATATATPTPEALPSPKPSPTESEQVSKAATEPTPEAKPADSLQTSPSPTPEPEQIAKSLPADESKSDKAAPVQHTVTKVIVAPGPTPAPLKDLIAANSPPAKSTDSSAVSEKPKPFFEPVVITIPKHDPQVIPPTTRPAADERGRVIKGKPITTDEAGSCSITVSQDKVVLVNNAGYIFLLVGVDNAGDLNSIRAVSSSPRDISVELDREAQDSVEGRRLFVIRSVSEKTGSYQVSFQLPCGKKEVSVTVR